MKEDKIEWVVKDVLARSSRPGRWDNRELPVVIQDWLTRARGMGIRSILCLLTQPELLMNYAVRGIDLLGTYRQAGFEVALVPVPDFQWPTIEPTDLFNIRTMLTSMPAPWLIHCSAGEDRTGCAVEFMREKPEVAGASVKVLVPPVSRRPRGKRHQ